MKNYKYSFPVLFLVLASFFVGFAFLSGDDDLVATSQSSNAHPVTYGMPELLWDNSNINYAGSGIVSSRLRGINDTNDVTCADDFVIPTGKTWFIDSISIRGFMSAGTQQPDSMNFVIRSNNGGLPGAILHSRNLTGITQIVSDTITTGIFSPPIEVSEGTYWLEVAAVYDTATVLANGRWNWAFGDGMIGMLSKIRARAGYFGPPFDWTNISALVPNSNSLWFRIYGEEIAEPSISMIHFPQYMQGLNGTNNGRIPFAYLATLENLTPNATYRYYNLLDTVGAPLSGAGIILFPEQANYRYASTGNLSNPDNYAEFTTDGSGSYTGWFASIPSGNAARFTPGKELQAVITTNNGAGGTAVVNRIRSTETVTVINWGTTSGAPLEGSLFWGQSTNGTEKNIVLLYDNVDGTGRPIATACLEYIGFDLTSISSILLEYRTNIANMTGRWGTIIPNNLPNGIRRIEERKLTTLPTDAPGDLVQFITEASGNWNGVANTVNPGNGSDITLVYNGPLPVDLISFNAATERNNVMLSWETAWEENNDRFEIQRRISANENSTWTTVGTVRGAGTTYEQQSYSFTDKNLSSGIYEYRLVQFDLNGNSSSDHELSGTVSIGTPDRFELTQNYPNPFNPVTKIDFQLPLEGVITLRVYDMTGREVTTVINEFRTAGYHSVQFDGSSLASGMYVYQLTAGSFTQTKKMLMIK